MKFGSPVPRKHSRIEIIPLIDVMFFLLASFMMVSLNMSKLTTVRVNTPTALTGEKDIKADVLQVAVDRNGNLFLGDDEVSPADLASVVSNRLARIEDLGSYPVYLTADEAAEHGVVMQVLRTVRNAGVRRVSFVVSPP